MLYKRSSKVNYGGLVLILHSILQKTLFLYHQMYKTKNVGHDKDRYAYAKNYSITFHFVQHTGTIIQLIWVKYQLVFFFFPHLLKTILHVILLLQIFHHLCILEWSCRCVQQIRKILYNDWTGCVTAHSVIPII